MKSFTNYVNENNNGLGDFNWDELRGYSFEAYPFKITLITNAQEDVIRRLWVEYDPANANENFDNFLKKKGYFAISAPKSDLRPLDRIG